MLKKGDYILIIVLIFIGLAGYTGIRLYNRIYGGENRIAVIKQNDNIIKKIDLNKIEEAERIEIEEDYHVTILIEKGRIRFEEANCPDKVCVDTGWLTDLGDIATCIPNRTIIKIEGEDDKVDGVAY